MWLVVRALSQATGPANRAVLAHGGPHEPLAMLRGHMSGRMLVRTGLEKLSPFFLALQNPLVSLVEGFTRETRQKLRELRRTKRAK